ncbi:MULTISPECIES: type I DNA topoisomerase [unclassified Actinomyces]|uniref:type I DNA topoisomerase n=1 Tax=unclassified Actinomyces TaxID=2609248 RepID=UPI002018167D|nr:MULTISPECIES: type I DNA topoisomerase [unclassified Actinomyces]MCL3777368.1 type I DNA topoisomerase [Actinomyces sp. AC-20-1]MCL3789337.1 type I DNA topoisomerase [Actinomyces sp. 187325]MCL3792523.1 type I DNA topoisomerase [Actinomyces sp. 186855]MCL3794004.1 type I DNA topoisomerase [Actinomyces sp. 217892]
MSKKLVIVESPNKVRSIAGYLGSDFDVEASVGHIRDLAQPSELPAEEKKGPYGKFAVDVEDGFKPYYVINPDKRKTVTQLRKALKEADELYLATDDDREGEAIAWHLLEVLKPKVPVKRMTFTEITREAVGRALENTRELDTDRVDAQETRRILDRLVGYEVSPVLWRKVRAGLSAGRVQSVATRLVVERERERMAFTAAGYWGVEAELAAGGGVGEEAQSFTARLATLDGRRVATGRDFNDSGQLRPAAVKAGTVHLHEGGARAVADAVLRSAPQVAEVEEKPYKRRPAAPFTTSTLQQEASRKLRMNPRETMRVAQGLYENGFITYMRTDSTVLSSQAVSAARAQVAELYGPEYVPAKPRLYATRTKGAQEAHEAIRPAGDHFRTPAQVADELSGSQFRLYELIWKRTVASQMADAVGSTATVRVQVPLTGADGGARDAGLTFRTAGLTASGTVITFRGFLAAYEEGRDADRYESGSDKDVRLPAMRAGDPLRALGAEAAGHETTPPPRYTEASLVKALEEREIGRPSTYAATMSVIADRGYVDHRGQALVPTWLAFAVTRLLEENFAELVDYDFTASMERDLDRIAAGEEERVSWLDRFYNGARAQEGADGEAGPTGERSLRQMLDNLGEIDARAVNSIDIGQGVTLRVGRYGPYLEDAEGARANVPSDIAPDELTVDRARELFERAADDGRELGTDPATGHTIIAKDGRYGPYVTEVLPEEAEDGADAGDAKPRKRAARKAAKPRTASLFKSMSLATVTLEQALDLLSLPRVVGQDAEGVDITAQNGRYGPYLKKGTDSRSLETEEQLFTVTLEQANELFAQPKRRRGQAAARGPLRELGTDPVSGRPVVIKDGRFGPYFTDGETNVTLRRDDDPATVTPERAYELLAEKRAKGPVKKRTTRRTTAKKPAAGRTASRSARKA